MRQIVLCSISAVLVTEASFHLLGVYDWPARVLGRFPALKLNYTIIFPLLLIIGLVALRRIWHQLPFPTFAILGVLTGLMFGPIAYAIAQLIDPFEKARFINGFKLTSLTEFIAAYFLFCFGATMSWLHGGVAALLTSLLEVAFGRKAASQAAAYSRDSTDESTSN